MRTWLLSVGMMTISMAFPLMAAEQELPMDHKFVVYYADNAPLEAFSPYSLLVLESDAHPYLEPLLSRKKTLLGYISLGEVAQSRPYFKKMEKAGVMLIENPNWQGSYAVDIRRPEWQQMVIERLVPAILAQGFHGIFIDTLDTPIELERQDPKRYAGMKQASVTLIKALRQHYPHMQIMLNRAYPLLPEVAGTIDMVLGESTFSSYDFTRKSYHRVEKNLYLEQVKMLKAAKRQNPELGVYTLDYCNKNEPATVAAIYKEQRKNGFIPYVATIGLDEIVHEPE